MTYETTLTINKQMNKMDYGLTRLICLNIRVPPAVANITRGIMFRGVIIRDKKKVRLTEANVIVSNILSCVRKGIDLHYSRSTANKKPSKANKKELQTKKIMQAIDVLVEHGYIENHITKPQTIEKYRLSSWITPTQMFFDDFGKISKETIGNIEKSYIQETECITLRDSNKKNIPYKNTEFIDGARKILVGINTLNSTHLFTDKDGVVFINHYTRIFNNSSFEEGGRFYGASIVNMNNKYKDRLRIKIDGESVVEVDFSGMHIRMLSILMGLEDLYTDHMRDIYTTPLPIEYRNEENRKLIKMGTNIMLNSTSAMSAIGAINDFIAESPKGTYCYQTGKQVRDVVNKSFVEFAEVFCSKSSTGLGLQNKDSLITNNILSIFLTFNKPILVVHDSYLVKESDVDLLINSMRDEFNKELKSTKMVFMKLNKIDDNGDVYSSDCSC